MTEKEVKQLCKSIDGLTKAVKENSRLHAQHMGGVEWLAESIDNFTFLITESLGYKFEGEDDCSCDDCQCKTSETNNVN